ncbi:unnamed protein product [Amoebophrya sp. A25]|nr:unnamed protein product [Amoebophrya sp. A25]|eukprot:GSA25T00011049001.1
MAIPDLSQPVRPQQAEDENKAATTISGGNGVVEDHTVGSSTSLGGGQLQLNPSKTGTLITTASFAGPQAVQQQQTPLLVNTEIISASRRNSFNPGFADNRDDRRLSHYEGTGSLFQNSPGMLLLSANNNQNHVRRRSSVTAQLMQSQIAASRKNSVNLAAQIAAQQSAASQLSLLSSDSLQSLKRPSGYDGMLNFFQSSAHVAALQQHRMSGVANLVPFERDFATPLDSRRGSSVASSFGGGVSNFGAAVLNGVRGSFSAGAPFAGLGGAELDELDELVAVDEEEPLDLNAATEEMHCVGEWRTIHLSQPLGSAHRESRYPNTPLSLLYVDLSSSSCTGSSSSSTATGTRGHSGSRAASRAHEQSQQNPSHYDSARPYFLVGLLSLPSLLKVVPPRLCGFYPETNQALAEQQQSQVGGSRGRFCTLPLDAFGRFLLCDGSSHAIFLVENGGELMTVAGCGKRGYVDGPLDICRLDTPTGLAVDPKTQLVYVADRGNHVIRKIDIASGLMTTVCGSGVQGNHDGRSRETQCLDAPTSLSFSQPHFLLISCGDNSLRKFNTKSGILDTILIGS